MRGLGKSWKDKICSQRVAYLKLRVQRNEAAPGTVRSISLRKWKLSDKQTHPKQARWFYPTLSLHFILFFISVTLNFNSIYFWLRWVLVAACRMFCCRACGHKWMCCESCPAACGILVPQSGIQPVSPALVAEFLTTGPPGKSFKSAFLNPSQKRSLQFLLKNYYQLSPFCDISDTVL